MTTTIRRGEVISPRRYGPFDASDVEAYAAASGDDNPLHTDPTLAARAGLPRPPVHGMLLMGCLEPFLQGWKPGARVVKLASKFIRPVLVGDDIEVSGKVVQATHGVPAIVRLTVKRDETIVCLAEVFVQP